MSRLACVGDNVIDVYPALGQAFPGGNAVNVAVAARRAGADSAYIGSAGSGADGALIRTALLAEGVDMSRMRVAAGPNAYFVVSLQGSERVFEDSDEGVSRFRLDDADFDYLSGCWCVHTGETGMLEGQLADLAGAARVSFDFSERPAAYYAPLLPHIWCACFSASHLSPGDAADLARQVAARGPAVVLVTQGARGALLLTADDGLVRMNAPPSTPVDTLGAGDSVIGGVLAELMRGADARTALAGGLALAARTCMHHGAFGYATPIAAAGLKLRATPG